MRHECTQHVRMTLLRELSHTHTHTHGHGHGFNVITDPLPVEPIKSAQNTPVASAGL